MFHYIPYSLRLSLVACLTVVLTLNPAFAGRILQCKPKSSCSRVCVPKVECSPCAPRCCPCPCATSAPNCGSKPKCGCDANPEVGSIGVVVSPDKTGDSSGGDSQLIPAPSESSTASVEPAKPQVPSIPTTEPSKVANEITEITPPVIGKVPPIAAPATSAVPDPNIQANDASVPNDLTKPMKADEVSEVPAVTDDDSETNPADAESDVKTDDDDLFAQPSDSDDDAMDSDDDAMENDDDAMEDDDDAMEDDAKPADSEMEDLFGTPDTEKPANDDKTDVEDLFGDASDEDATPEGNDADDLFKSDDETPPVDDLEMEETLPGEESAKESESDLFDDLFSTPEKKEAVEPSDKPRSDALEDLFDIGGGKPVTFRIVPSNHLQLSEALATPKFKGAEIRVWRDNTGFFSTEGRLVQILPNEVRIQKSNGKFCNVPLERLSVQDYRYVRWVVQALAPPSSAKFVSTSNSDAGQQ